jgi:general secretion pathway protein L
MAANPPLTRVLDPLRLRWLDSPLPGWLHAGAEALRDWLPATWRRRLAAGRRKLWLQVYGHSPSEGGLRLEREIDEYREPLGMVDAHERELLELLHARLAVDTGTAHWLLLEPSQVLRRVLALPLAAEPRLRDVLAHEIDRQTPFTTDQVTFEARVLERDVAARQVRVELLVWPKAGLEDALARLGPLGLSLAGVDVRGADGQPLGVNLLPRERRHVATDRARQWHLLLAAVAIVALVAAMWEIRSNRAEALAALEAQVAAGNTAVRDVRALRNALATRGEAANFLAETRKDLPTMLELLDELTRRIPDDTSLEKLAVADGKIVLIGQSRQAPALVGLLQDSPLIKSPALAGAVQNDPRTGQDRFNLTAVVAGGPADTPPPAPRPEASP